MTEARPDWAAFTPSDETRELVVMARAHFAELAPDSQLLAVAAGNSADDLWPALAEGGYTHIGVPEDSGGIGTLVDLVALLEEAGRALLPAPLTTTIAAAHTLLAAGLAPDGSIAALAERRSDGTFFAFDGLQATTFITLEPVDGGTRVARFTSDARITEPRPLDRSRTGAILEHPTVVDERLVDTPIDELLAVARICIAADLVGTATRALHASIAHASAREQFGRTIGSFQAVKHRLADLHVEIERARSLVLGAAVAAGGDRLSTETRDLSMLAKAAASEAAETGAHIHTQLLGAMGLTFEGGSHLEVRRARHTARHLGSAADLYARVGAFRADRTVERAGR